ncbi:MAG: PilZ domain-containing protein, partial [Candidatus Sulfotelmatobacter sp.]|jgi:PilZ domain-containing protein
MQASAVSARQARAHYRHELRTLTYVILDDANGGIIRNLNQEGVAVQAVAPLHEQQRVRLRFELRFPRLRVDTFGQVSWASPSGQCGIRFVDMPEHTSHQINEWIFSNLLNAIAREAMPPRLISGASVVSIAREENLSEEDDGLILSATARPAIRLEPVTEMRDDAEVVSGDADYLADLVGEVDGEVNWLSRPLSGRTLAWLVDSLVVTAALLLFALIFLSIAHELPPWPLTLGTASGAAVFVAAAYWSVFALFGGPSLGARLAQGVRTEREEDDEGRFR